MASRRAQPRWHIEWSKIVGAWVLILNTYVVYHGINLCYVMIENQATTYSFGWLATLISVVVGMGNIVLAAYMSKSGKEGVEKIKTNSPNGNYP